MKITESTDRRLVIEHRPWLLAGTVGGFGLVALYAGVTGAEINGMAERVLVLVLGVGTIAIAWYFFAFLRITFDRDRGEVEHVSLRPLGTRRKYLRLDRVQGAVVEVDSDDGAHLTRLALQTEDGRAQLEFGFGGNDRRALAVAVNEWLTRPR